MFGGMAAKVGADLAGTADNCKLVSLDEFRYKCSQFNKPLNICNTYILIYSSTLKGRSSFGFYFARRDRLYHTQIAERFPIHSMQALLPNNK